MESYKDVIVSQPPAMYAKSSYANNISVENFKGILLCERPSTVGSFGTTTGFADSSKPFVPASRTSGPAGLAPSDATRALRTHHEEMRTENMRSQRHKTRQALSRHRQWLRSFAKQIKMMKESDLQREIEAARGCNRLRERERSKRMEAQRAEEEEAASRSAPCCPCAVAAPPTPPLPPVASYNTQSVVEKRATGTRKANGSKKPKWAMTEEEALDDELDVDRDLLDFAENLNYDKFISDYEVSEALGVMRDRIAQIARANNWSDDDIRQAAAQSGREDDDDLSSLMTPSEGRLIGSAGDASKRAVRVQSPTMATDGRAAIPGVAATHNQDWDSSIGRGRVLRKAISRDALALAQRLLAATPSLLKVYTKQSLARALQRYALEGNVDITAAILLKAEGGAKHASVLPPATTSRPPLDDSPGAIPEPRVVQVGANAMPCDGDAGPSDFSLQPGRILRELQTSKERTQGLPYLYRCPAI